MKFRFKVQSFQTDAVDAVVDCFKGQPPSNDPRYRIDPGVVKTGQTARLEMDEGFCNNDLALPLPDILKKIQSVQVLKNFPSPMLSSRRKSLL
jgi:type III restriction enzyme